MWCPTFNNDITSQENSAGPGHANALLQALLFEALYCDVHPMRRSRNGVSTCTPLRGRTHFPGLTWLTNGTAYLGLLHLVCKQLESNYMDNGSWSGG